MVDLFELNRMFIFPPALDMMSCAVSGWLYDATEGQRTSRIQRRFFPLWQFMHSFLLSI